MSLTKREFWNEITAGQNDNVLLSTAIRDVERAARRVQTIEQTADVTIGEVCDLARDLHLALTTLELLRKQSEAVY